MSMAWARGRRQAERESPKGERKERERERREREGESCQDKKTRRGRECEHNNNAKINALAICTIEFTSSILLGLLPVLHELEESFSLHNYQ